MKRNGLIMLLAALLILPTLVLSSCAKQVQETPGLTDEEKARLEALAREKAAAKDAFLNEHVYFDFDKYNIRADMEPVLQSKADYMAANENLTVEVQGHCDERGTEAYNMALGDRRANAAANYMETLGVAASRMSTISYGEERPLDPGHDEAAWSQNRRAQFVIIGE